MSYDCTAALQPGWQRKEGQACQTKGTTLINARRIPGDWGIWWAWSDRMEMENGAGRVSTPLLKLEGECLETCVFWRPGE